MRKRKKLRSVQAGDYVTVAGERGARCPECGSTSEWIQSSGGDRVPSLCDDCVRCRATFIAAEPIDDDSPTLADCLDGW